jgi:hypothetical protein
MSQFPLGKLPSVPSLPTVPTQTGTPNAPPNSLRSSWAPTSPRSVRDQRGGHQRTGSQRLSIRNMTVENPGKPVIPQEQEESNRPVKVESEKVWTPGRVRKSGTDSKAAIEGFVNWLEDVKGRPEKGADYVRKLGEFYTSELADQVIEAIKKNFTLEKIGTVLERMQQLVGKDLGPGLRLIVNCYHRLQALQEERQVPLSPEVSELPRKLSFEAEFAQGMKRYFDTLTTTDDKKAWDESYEALREITHKRKRDGLLPEEIHSCIDAELKGRSPKDLVAIYKGAEHLRDENQKDIRYLASHMSSYLLTKLEPGSVTEETKRAKPRLPKLDMSKLPELPDLSKVKAKFSPRSPRSPRTPSASILPPPAPVKEEDLALAQSYIDLVLNKKDNAGDAGVALEFHIRKASRSSRWQALSNFQALFTRCLEKTEKEDLVRLKLRLPQGSHSLLLTGLTTALDATLKSRLTNLERRLIERRIIKKEASTDSDEKGRDEEDLI